MKKTLSFLLSLSFITLFLVSCTNPSIPHKENINKPQTENTTSPSKEDKKPSSSENTDKPSKEEDKNPGSSENINKPSKDETNKEDSQNTETPENNNEEDLIATENLISLLEGKTYRLREKKDSSPLLYYGIRVSGIYEGVLTFYIQDHPIFIEIDKNYKIKHVESDITSLSSLFTVGMMFDISKNPIEIKDKNKTLFLILDSSEIKDDVAPLLNNNWKQKTENGKQFMDGGFSFSFSYNEAVNILNTTVIENTTIEKNKDKEALFLDKAYYVVEVDKKGNDIAVLVENNDKKRFELLIKTDALYFTKIENNNNENKVLSIFGKIDK